MKKIHFLILFTFASIIALGQTISITKLAEDNGKIIVTYTILYSTPEQLFDINLIVTQFNGAPIQVITTSGDIGTNVKGGTGKQIVWNYEQDGVFLNENVNVQISANASVDANYHSMAKLLFASTILPGKGVSILNHSNSYIGWSILGYGLIGASGGGYLLSQNTYSKYNSALTISERDNYYSNYQAQLLFSGISAASAIGVWSINYFKLFSTKSRIKHANNTAYWQISPKYDNKTYSNMFALSYRF